MLIGISGKMHSGKDTLGKLIQYANYVHNRGDRHCMSMENWLRNDYGRAAEYMCGWEIKKFATKLKQIASILTGIPVEKFEDQDFKDSFLGEEWNQPIFGRYGDGSVYAETTTPMKVRTFLQLLGTNAMRVGLHTETWVNALFADYGNCTKCGEKENLHDTYAYGMGHGDVINILCNECGTFFNYPNWIMTDVRFPNEAKAIKDRGGILVRINRLNIPSSTHESEVALDNYRGFDYVLDNDGTIEELAGRVKELLMVLKNRHDYTGRPSW